jgi:succinyl-CoA synthetase beta subunit
MDIKGFKVPLVYCESALDIEREIYLGFTVDRDARANILMLSSKGGVDIEQVAEESPESIGGGAKAEVVENAMAVILMNPKVKGVLMNVFGGITRGDEVARGLVTARDNLKLKLPLVVRLSGTNEEEGRRILKEHGIEPGASAWEAAQKIVELSRAGVA